MVPMAGLLRRYRDGEAAIDGYAEDYAYLIWGLLELFQASGDAAWLEWALDASGASRTSSSGTRGRRAGSARPGDDPTVLLASEGGLRRRRAGREFGVGAERADARAPDWRRSTCVSGRSGRWRATVLASAPPARAIPMMLCALSAWHAG